MLEIQNIGAEYFHFIMIHYFPTDKLKDLDIRTIVDTLKLIERDASLMLDSAASREMKIKYKFSPVETYQMKTFIETKKDKEF